MDYESGDDYVNIDNSGSLRFAALMSLWTYVVFSIISVAFIMWFILTNLGVNHSLEKVIIYALVFTPPFLLWCASYWFIPQDKGLKGLHIQRLDVKHVGISILIVIYFLIILLVMLFSMLYLLFALRSLIY